MQKQITIVENTALSFIKTVADELGISHEEGDREYCLSLPEIFGHGYIKTVDFDHGITVYEFDCTLEDEMELQFVKQTVQPLVLIFNREDPIVYSNKVNNTVNQISQLECLMFCGGVECANALKINKKKPTCFFVIRINRKDFEEKIESFLKDMNKDLEVIFRDTNGINPICNKGYYSLDIASFIEEFTTTELTGFMQHVFLEGKVFEILTNYLRQFLDDKQNPKNRKILRQNTVDKIEEASHIIENEINVLGNIMHLASRVGLNQNTLQEGFNHLYKKSVNQYIRDVRLAKARELMENTDLNITEITYKIGINSRSYFSKLFKEKFGVSPKQYIIINRRSNESDLSA